MPPSSVSLTMPPTYGTYAVLALFGLAKMRWKPGALTQLVRAKVPIPLTAFDARFEKGKLR